MFAFSWWTLRVSLYLYICTHSKYVQRVRFEDSGNGRIGVLVVVSSLTKARVFFLAFWILKKRKHRETESESELNGGGV